MAKKTAIVTKKDEELAPIYEEAATEINKYAESTAKNYAAIGQYLLDTFFDGDVEAAKDRSPKKGLSLRKLASMPELDLSYPTLVRTIDVARVDKALKGDSALSQLSATHKMTICLAREEYWEEYAKMVIVERLSTRQLKMRMTDEGAIVARGRAALDTEWKKSLAQGGMMGTFNALLALSKVKDDATDKINKSAALKALKEAESAKKKLDSLVAKLRERTK